MITGNEYELRRKFTDAVKLVNPEADGDCYKKYLGMLQQLVIGIPVTTYREKYNIRGTIYDSLDKGKKELFRLLLFEGAEILSNERCSFEELKQKLEEEKRIFYEEYQQKAGKSPNFQEHLPRNRASVSDIALDKAKERIKDPGTVGKVFNDGALVYSLFCEGFTRSRVTEIMKEYKKRELGFYWYNDSPYGREGERYLDELSKAVYAGLAEYRSCQELHEDCM